MMKGSHRRIAFGGGDMAPLRRSKKRSRIFTHLKPYAKKGRRNKLRRRGQSKLPSRYIPWRLYIYPNLYHRSTTTSRNTKPIQKRRADAYRLQQGPNSPLRLVRLVTPLRPEPVFDATARGGKKARKLTPIRRLQANKRHHTRQVAICKRLSPL